MKYVIRIIALPFFAAIALIGALYGWIKYCIAFMSHGGEAIAYCEKVRRKSIQDVYNHIVDTMPKP